jgi:Spy/CpxP family protein refolding chaperone
VGIMVAVVLVGGMLGGGALWALSNHFKPDPKMLTEVQAPMGARVAAQIQPRPPAEGVQQTRPGNYQVRAGEVVMFASKGPNDTDWNLRTLYNKSDLLPADQQAALVARMRLTADGAYAKFLKVSDEQIAKLKEIPATASIAEMAMPPDDLARLKAAWAQYIAAQKSDNEQAVVKLLKELGVKNLAGTRAAITARADQIKAILTPEQIAPFKT